MSGVIIRAKTFISLSIYEDFCVTFRKSVDKTLYARTKRYGRREISDNAVIGENSAYSDVVRTLRYDFTFDMFNANSTLNHSSVDERNTDGHIGIFGGEGHFGLSLIGDASVENCNASHSCCDVYEEFENGVYFFCRLLFTLSHTTHTHTHISLSNRYICVSSIDVVQCFRSCGRTRIL